MTHRLSNIIARRVWITSTILIIVCGIVSAAVMYAMLDSSTKANLESETTTLVQKIDSQTGSGSSTEADSTAMSILQTQVVVSAPAMRITLISADGSVLYDTVVDASTLENHAQRPEFIEATSTGESVEGRYSTTLHEDTIYCAERLADGSVLRLAMEQSSIWRMMAGAAIAILIVVILGVIASFIVGRLIAKRVSSTLTEVDLENPLQNDAPEEIKPLLERLDDQRKRLDSEEAQRRRFTSSASHELKTPLTVISGYSEIISNGLAKPEDVANFAGIIQDESVHMKSIVDDLIILSRLDDATDEISKLPMDEHVPIDNVIIESAHRLSDMAEDKGVSIDLHLPSFDGSDEIVVMGNRRMLEELVRNLMENAIRYNVRGGVVEATAAISADGAPYIQISDTGIGIPDEFKQRVFERFFCVDESRSKESGGSGLGLAIVKHVAQLHKATIKVEDNSPTGTTFTVAFNGAVAPEAPEND